MVSLVVTQAYQQYLDVKYTGSYLDEYGVEDELAASEEPFEASFTRLMDITRMITADEQQPQVCGVGVAGSGRGDMVEFLRPLQLVLFSLTY